MSATDLPPASPGDGEMPPTMDPVEGRPPRQAASSGLPDNSAPHTGISNIVLRKTERVSIHHHRVPLRTQRSALSSEPTRGDHCPSSHVGKDPRNMCLFLLFADLWLRAIETNCRPAFFGRVEARFALTHAVARPHRHSETAMEPQPEPLFLARMSMSQILYALSSTMVIF